VEKRLKAFSWKQKRRKKKNFLFLAIFFLMHSSGDSQWTPLPSIYVSVTSDSFEIFNLMDYSL
jgi:hypothetical protein